jgi:hypothetical protein
MTAEPDPAARENRHQNPTESAVAGALLGFSAVVVSGFFGTPASDWRLIGALCAFGIAIPLLSAYLAIMYSSKPELLLPWIDNVWIVGTLAALVGFGFGLWHVSEIAAIVGILGVVAGFFVLLASAQRWGAPKGPRSGWKPAYQPTNEFEP